MNEISEKIRLERFDAFTSAIDMFMGAGCMIKPFNDDYRTKRGRPLHYGVIAPKDSALVDGQRLIAEVFCETNEILPYNNYVDSLIRQYKDTDKPLSHYKVSEEERSNN